MNTKTYNPLTDQLKQMDADRAKLLQRVNETSGFEREQAQAILKAHDVQVGRLLGIPNTSAEAQRKGM